METIGIICEYNPFHNGHLYHINKIKEKYPNSTLILCLSTYFTQRGEISVLTKEDKIKIALENNIDLVVELPTRFTCQSADIFAYASITILNHLKVDRIIFGSESNNIKYLEEIVKKQLKNDYKENLKKYLKEGYNYPSALNNALNIKINTPNDLLGISYIKTILANKYNIEYECIKRTSTYLDIESNDEIVSASNIRNKIKQGININKYINYNYEFIKINEELLFKLLKYKIITSDLNKYLGVDEGLEYKINKEINNTNNIEELVFKIKSKRYTYNRIKRMLIHILLDIKKEDNKQEIEYIKILGFNSKGRNYIKKLESNIPISTKISDKYIDRKYELKASQIYDIINNTNTYKYEIKNKPIIK